MSKYRRGWRYSVSIIYIFIWQILRIGAASLLLIFYVPALFFWIGPQNVSEEDIERYKNYQPPNPLVTCGMISGTVLEVSRKYIMFWPEYEGKSSWDKDFIFNKKGCDANLRTLDLTVSWPGFQIVKSEDYFARRDEISILEITVAPLVKREDFMGRKLKFYALARQGGGVLSAEDKNYEVELNLFSAERSDHIYTDIMNRYYWSEVNGEVVVLFECYRARKNNQLKDCKGYFLLDEFEAFVRVRFSFEELKHWQEIVEQTKHFILSKVKNK